MPLSSPSALPLNSSASEGTPGVAVDLPLLLAAGELAAADAVVTDVSVDDDDNVVVAGNNEDGVDDEGVVVAVVMVVMVEVVVVVVVVVVVDVMVVVVVVVVVVTVVVVAQTVSTVAVQFAVTPCLHAVLAPHCAQGARPSLLHVLPAAHNGRSQCW